VTDPTVPALRRTVRIASCVIPAAAALSILTSTPAWALDDGEISGEGTSAIETILTFLVAPGALFVLIALLVYAPSMSRSPRYRPSVGWWAAPIWFNGPEGSENLDATVRAATPTRNGGGASARW